MTQDTWTPEYAPWRHGGWYVTNLHYASGAVGCVSRNYPDKRWRIVCARQDDVTYANRDAAACAERRLAAHTAERCSDPSTHVGGLTTTE